MVYKICIFAVTIAFFSYGHGQLTGKQVIVAQDGSGDYSTINKAIASAPNNSAQKYYINIRKGIYSEYVIVQQEKKNLILIGEGMDQTIVSGSRSHGSGFATDNSATVDIQGDGFIAQGITFQNTAGAKMEQAVALMAQATSSTFYQCRFEGYQDTLYTLRGTQFFRECEVLGTIDFIFGDSSAVFQNCMILVRRPLPKQYLTITAQGRDMPRARTGFVFQNCTISATKELAQADQKFRCYLGRPWKDFSRTVFMQSYIGNLIDPRGWIEWNGQPPVDPYYGEYDNRGPGAKVSGRTNWSIVIATSTQASEFTLRNFLQGAAWIPSSIPHYLDLL